MCGEAASDPRWALLAVGLGVTELSMQAVAIPEARATLRGVTFERCRDAAERALGRRGHAIVDAQHAVLKPVSEPERVLLRYVELVTRHAWRATAADAQHLRDAGWTDEQIAEAVYITAMFAFFNRVADALNVDLEPEMPPR